MDWNAAIEKHREALTHILASLVAMAGLSPTLPRHLRLAVLRLLRPAESATRRLIIAAARGLVVTLPPRNANPTQVSKTKIVPAIPRYRTVLPPAAPRALSLPLFDPLQHPFRPRRVKQYGVPRISFPGFTEPFPVADRHPLAPDDAIDAGRLCRRIEALASALDDLPRQALRFARWRIRRDAAGAQNKEHRDAAGARNEKGRGAGRIRRLWPLRPGHPPGSRRRPSHEVHEVLAAAHGLAFRALEHPYTS